MGKFWKNPSKEKILLGLIAGILLFLLSFPLEQLTTGGQKTAKQEVQEQTRTASSYQAQLEEQLEALLGQVKGAGKVKVMILFRDSGEKIAQKDVQTESSHTQEGKSDDTGSSDSYQRQETTVLENGQIPWISQELLPQVSGIAVVAQGAGSAAVQSRISSMLEALFGLPAHKITVLEGVF